MGEIADDATKIIINSPDELHHLLVSLSDSWAAQATKDRHPILKRHSLKVASDLMSAAGAVSCWLGAREKLKP